MPSSSDERKPYQKIRHPIEDDEQTELHDFEARNMKGERCPYCNLPLYKRHCKVCCEQCGVIKDCSDPF